MYVFFFQAEDGIRDLTVTGVQTCASDLQEVSAALQLVGGGGAAAGAQGAVAPAGAAAVRSGTVPGTAAAGAASAVAGLGEGNPLFGALRIMPIERLNSILVITQIGRAAWREKV